MNTSSLDTGALLLTSTLVAARIETGYFYFQLKQEIFLLRLRSGKANCLFPCPHFLSLLLGWEEVNANFPPTNRISVAKVQETLLDEINIRAKGCIHRCAMQKLGEDLYSSTLKHSRLNRLYRTRVLHTLLNYKKGKSQTIILKVFPIMNSHCFGILSLFNFTLRMKFCQSSSLRLSNT